MKLVRDFAPVTLRLETKQDYSDFLDILQRARSQNGRKLYQDTLDEKIDLLIRDLTK